jgi:DNA-directed RNA polymerase subunit RPC12/RpoP
MVLTILPAARYIESMVVKCAWCGRILDASESSLTSHGICPECKKAFMKNRRNGDSLLSGILSLKKRSSPGQDDSACGREEREMDFII